MTQSPTRALVYGLAVTGASTVRALRRRGVDVVVVDDRIDDAKLSLADDLDVELVAGAATDLAAIVRRCDLVSPAPGLPETHRLFDLAGAAGVEVVSELELAYRWEQERPGGPRPILAVTGTDGKTSTTKMAVAMLAAAGVRSIDAGNTDTPLVEALDHDLDAFVVECSSFRLAFTPTFRADAAAWLNLHPDHLNWHRSMASYESAKAQIFANQRGDDVAVGLTDDPVVERHLASAPARAVRFGLERGDYRLLDGALHGPAGPIVGVAEMRRALPHDITNGLAAAALVIESGLATPADVARALADFQSPPHRIEPLGVHRGVAWYNDSKATTPNAAAAAIRSFERIVLIAGGADKGVDLAPMITDTCRIRSVIGIGTTGTAVAERYAAATPRVERVVAVADLAEAVRLAHEQAGPGDTVLLSPGCASLDQFTNYEARGEAFRSLVTDLVRADSRDAGTGTDGGTGTTTGDITRRKGAS